MTLYTTPRSERVAVIAHLSMKLDSSSIRALLTPAMVLDHFEIKRRGSAQLSVQLCPLCGQLKRGSLSIHPETGLFKCFHCGAHGGLFDLVAGYANLDPKQDFQRVLGVAAIIAGVPRGVPDGEYTKLIEEHRAKRAAYNEAQAARQARIRARMPGIWKALDRRHGKGEAYLRGRSIDPEFQFQGDAVRYSDKGDPAVRLHDLATGSLTGIQYRMLEGDSKLLVQPGSQTTGACLIGRIAKLEKTRLAIIVEGLADTLVAQMLWREAAVFGAAGADHLEAIGKAVGAAVAQRRGILLIVPDNDPDDEKGQAGAGIRGAARAVMAAMAAGVELVDQLRESDEAKMQLVDLGRNLGDVRHHDLADAWRCSRWKWKWPEEVAT